MLRSTDTGADEKVAPPRHQHGHDAASAGPSSTPLQEDGPGTAQPSLTETLSALGADLRGLLDEAQELLRLHGLRLQARVRRAGWRAAQGLLLGGVVLAALVLATQQIIVGLVEGLSAILGDRTWLARLLVGVLVLVASLGGLELLRRRGEARRIARHRQRASSREAP